MSQTALHLTESVIPRVPVRQFVLTFPPPLRYLLAYDNALCSRALALFVNQVMGHYRCILARVHNVDINRLQGGTITSIQRAALQASLHFHTIALDGAYLVSEDDNERPRFLAAPAVTRAGHDISIWARAPVDCRSTTARLGGDRRNRETVLGPLPMGASGWHYFVPWDRDIAAALGKLREQVFVERRYYGGPRNRAHEARTIDEAVALAGEEGTHSILDVHRVVDTPIPRSPLFWEIERTEAGKPPSQEEQAAYWQLLQPFEGAIGPVEVSRVVALVGDRPLTREPVEMLHILLTREFPRNTGAWIEVLDEQGRPSELCFTGKSGD